MIEFENLITKIKYIPKVLSDLEAVHSLVQNKESFQGISYLCKNDLESLDSCYSFTFHRNKYDICYNFKINSEENVNYIEISLKDGLKHICLEDFILVLCALDFSNEVKLNIYFKQIPQHFTLSFDCVLLKSEWRTKLLLTPFSIQKSYVYDDGNIHFLK